MYFHQNNIEQQLEKVSRCCFGGNAPLDQQLFIYINPLFPKCSKTALTSLFDDNEHPLNYRYAFPSTVKAKRIQYFIIKLLYSKGVKCLILCEAYSCLVCISKAKWNLLEGNACYGNKFIFSVVFASMYREDSVSQRRRVPVIISSCQCMIMSVAGKPFLFGSV